MYYVISFYFQHLTSEHRISWSWNHNLVNISAKVDKIFTWQVHCTHLPSSSWNGYSHTSSFCLTLPLKSIHTVVIDSFVSFFLQDPSNPSSLFSSSFILFRRKDSVFTPVCSDLTLSFFADVSLLCLEKDTGISSSSAQS